MKLIIDPKKISFFEDSTPNTGERLIELIVDGHYFGWSSKFYDESYLNEVSEEIHNTIINGN